MQIRQFVDPLNRRQDWAGKGKRDKEGTGTEQGVVETVSGTHRRADRQQGGEEQQLDHKTSTGNQRLESGLRCVHAEHKRQSGRWQRETHSLNTHNSLRKQETVMRVSHGNNGVANETRI